MTPDNFLVQLSKCREEKEWWARQDLNPQPDGYEPSALTIELQAHRCARFFGRGRAATTFLIAML